MARVLLPSASASAFSISRRSTRSTRSTRFWTGAVVAARRRGAAAAAAHGVGEDVGGDHVLAERDHALHLVLELADVARPVVGGERARCTPGAERLRAAALAARASVRKCSTSSGMSSLRSRSGGSADRQHLQAVVEVLAELARLARAASRSLLLARDDAHVDLADASCRRRGGSRPPAARAGASSASRGSCPRPRRGRACPWSASSKRPFLSRSAPVNEPRTWPKSSLSSSVSVSAAQFSERNGLLARAGRCSGSRARSAPCPCRTRPRSGPAPRSATILSSRRSTSRIARARPMMCG